MKEPFDSSKYIMRKHLEALLHIPFTDADIALANVRYVQVTNSRWYEKTLAADALEQLYLRRIAENHDRLVLHDCGIFHKREAIYKERLERVLAFKKSLEVSA
jgi:hypothetical protein